MMAFVSTADGLRGTPTGPSSLRPKADSGRPATHGLRVLHGLLLACIGLLGGTTSLATTFYTSIQGDDTNPGTSESPWRTIKRGVQAAMPGDTLVVRSGTYPERVLSVRGGRGESTRITFRTEGTVVMQGWKISHPFVSIEGFDITGHSASSTADGHVRLDRDADEFRMTRCTIRDAIQLVRDDVRFESAGSRIVSEVGGFLAAGFAPGQYVTLERASSRATLTAANGRSLAIASVTDTTITVTNAVNDQPPQSLYLTTSRQFGVSVDSGAERAVVRECVFRNLGLDAWFVTGTNHVFEANLIEQMNGWNAMHFGGTGHLFRRNVIRNSPAIAYSPSPDAFDNFAPAAYNQVTFKQNFVVNFQGVLAAQKGSGVSTNHSKNLALIHNVFVDTGWLTLVHPQTRIEHNTFLRCAKTANAVASQARHPITLKITVPPATGTDDARESVVRNNAFVDCGQAVGSLTLNQVGWYEMKGPTDTFVAEGNFVAGSPPGYFPRDGWPEASTTNGGNPMFFDESNLLGPDGLPFTGDDGLWPWLESPLVGRGVGGRTIGAYEAVPAPSPHIRVIKTSDGTLRLSWRQDGRDWTIETSPTARGPWRGYAAWPSEVDGMMTVTIPLADSKSFFRLVE